MPKMEFILKAPFLNFNEDSKYCNKRYIDKACGFIQDQNVLNIISDYLYRNNLSIINYVDYKKELKSITMVNNYVFTDDDRKNICSILKILNLPSTNYVLNNVIKDYLNGKYNVSNMEEEEKWKKFQLIILIHIKKL